MSKVCADALFVPMMTTEEEAPTKMEWEVTAMNNPNETAYGRRKHFEIARALYEQFESVRKLWEFVETARLYVNRFIKRVKATIAPASCIKFTDGAEPLPANTQQAYLTRLLDANDALLFGKIGTTTRETIKRMKEHLRYYKKDGVCKIEVSRVWDCGDVDAEGLESFLRAHYIKKHSGTFRKNDRFINVDFDLAEADEIVANYLGKKA